MTTAKQIAARKKFAEMAKSGALAKKRRTAVKKAPAKRKTTPRAEKIDKASHHAKIAGLNTIYLVEISKDKKQWSFVGAYSSSNTAKREAEYMADEYSDQYIRVRSEKVK